MLFSTLMWKLYVKHFYENAAKIKMQWEGYDLASIKSRKIERTYIVPPVITQRL